MDERNERASVEDEDEVDNLTTDDDDDTEEQGSEAPENSEGEEEESPSKDEAEANSEAKGGEEISTPFAVVLQEIEALRKGTLDSKPLELFSIEEFTTLIPRLAELIRTLYFQYADTTKATDWVEVTGKVQADLLQLIKTFNLDVPKTFFDWIIETTSRSLDMFFPLGYIQEHLEKVRESRPKAIQASLESASSLSIDEAIAFLEQNGLKPITEERFQRLRKGYKKAKKAGLFNEDEHSNNGVRERAAKLRSK